MNNLIIVRGAGDLATGVICRLVRCGYPVLAIECDRPSAIRRKVALCEAVYTGEAEVEGVTAKKVFSHEEAFREIREGNVPVLIDSQAACVSTLKPVAVVDAIIAKKNMGTNRKMAPITIALGPGYKAPEDVDAVIETMRGHDLARITYNGSAVPDTGKPGNIGGYDKERVIHSPAAGVFKGCATIADVVQQGDVIGRVDAEPVYASITGVLRGIIRDDFTVTKGFKIADIDPRESQVKNCFTISDKARTLGGSVVEALCVLKREKGIF